MHPDHFKPSKELTFKGLAIKVLTYCIEFPLSGFVVSLLILLLCFKIIWFKGRPSLILSVPVLSQIRTPLSLSHFSDLVFWICLCSARNLGLLWFLVAQKLSEENLQFLLLRTVWGLFFFVLLFVTFLSSQAAIFVLFYSNTYPSVMR